MSFPDPDDDVPQMPLKVSRNVPSQSSRPSVVKPFDMSGLGDMLGGAGAEVQIINELYLDQMSTLFSPEEAGEVKMIDKLQGTSKWTVLYPIYFDRKAPLRHRRVPLSQAVERPDVEQIMKILKSLKYDCLLELHKGHPASWGNPGRIRVRCTLSKLGLIKQVATHLGSGKLNTHSKAKAGHTIEQVYMKAEERRKAKEEMEQQNKKESSQRQEKEKREKQLKDMRAAGGSVGALSAGGGKKVKVVRR